MTKSSASLFRINRRKNPWPPVEDLEMRTLLSVSFAGPSFYTGVSNVTGIAQGVLTSSNKPDIVVVGDSPSSGIPVFGVYLNSGTGTFGTPTLYPFDGTPTGIALGDFTGNGNLDVAVVDSSINQLVVFDGTGDGNFVLSGGASLGGTTGDTVVAVGDFNDDGKDDIAVVDPVDSDVVVYFSNGNGSFAQEQNISVPMPENVIVGDFSGDPTHPDLAILSGNGSVYVALNKGTGLFNAPVAYPPGSGLTSTTSLATADFNKDTLDDLAVGGTFASGGAAGVLLNQGAGVFGTANDISTAAAPVTMVAGDFSVDGDPDIALLSATGAMTILPGNGDGTFGAPVSVFSTQLGSVGSQAIAADFNGDGSPDIAFLSETSGNTFGVTLNQSAGNIITPPPPTNTSVLVPTLAKPLPTGNLIAGQTIKPIHEVINLANTSKTTFSGNVTLQMIFSPTPTTSSTQEDVGAKITRNLVIKAGKSKAIAVTINSLPANLTGTAHLLAQITDFSGDIGLGASASTVNIVAPTIDLTGSFPKLPAASKSAKGLTFNFNVLNDGNITASGNLLIELATSPTMSLPAGATPLSFTKAVKIKAGKSTSFHIKGVIAPAGTSAYLIVQIDPDNAFNDVNLANNTIVSGTAVAFSQ